MLTKRPTWHLIAGNLSPLTSSKEGTMINHFKAKLMAIALSAVLSVDQAFAMGWLPHDPKDRGGSPSAAPELDGPGGIAAIAVIVSVALVLFNRSRNR
jgi:hypothetical protein